MSLDSLNLNLLKIFMHVFKARSMTSASRELHLTQSGVSQHIKALEATAGVVLFDRIGRTLVPTAHGKQLFELCESTLSAIDQGFAGLKGVDTELTGTLSIGMPVEFGINVVMPVLSQFAEKNPRVAFQLRMDFASVMNELLLKGELDFAFVDEFRMDRKIQTVKVFDEILELCCSEAYLKKLPFKEGSSPGKAFFESLEYIEYQPNAPILGIWFKHHLKIALPKLKIRATVMDAQAVARLILGGMGVGVVPGHLLTKLQAEGHKLHKFRGRGVPVKNSISIAYLQERTFSRQAQALRDWFQAAL